MGSAQPTGQREPSPPASQEPERVGVVSLVRMVKDDGRQLILYERSDRSPDGGGGA
jgi:hypothetical protein